LVYAYELKWVRASARQAKAAGGMPAAMLANPKGLIFSGTATFSSADIICAVSPHSLHVAPQALSLPQVG
jgi:hypothetical protein